jgi:hypothetical protein
MRFKNYHLFAGVEFILHSGGTNNYKINIDCTIY